VPFTQEVKQELSRHEEKRSCCRSWELAAFLILRGYLSIRDGSQTLIVQVDYINIARHLFSLLKTAGIQSPDVIRKLGCRLGKISYLVQVAGADQVEALLVCLNLKESGQTNHLSREFRLTPRKQCCRRAFVRGAFMASGSLSVSGRSGYHLEIGCSYQEDAAFLQKCLHFFSIKAFLRQHHGNNSIYLKDAEAIADFLRIIGAGSALLCLENIRVVKSMRNQVNRQVNCDTANLQKIVNSAQQQLALIEWLDGQVGLHNLPPVLREAARLRRCFPEASLKELGAMFNPPVSKSGVNHRFRKLLKFAEKGGLKEGKPKRPST